MWGKCLNRRGISRKFRRQPKGSELKIVLHANFGVVAKISQPLFVSRVLTVST